MQKTGQRHPASRNIRNIRRHESSATEDGSEIPAVAPVVMRFSISQYLWWVLSMPGG